MTLIEVAIWMEHVTKIPENFNEQTKLNLTGSV